MNPVNVSIHDKVAVIELNTPDNRNALSVAMVKALSAAINDCRADRACRTIVLTRAGLSFCSGLDLRNTPSPGDIPGTEAMGILGFTYKIQEYIANMITLIHESEKPVIAAIRGHCYGGGLSIAAAADVRVCDTSAKFCAAYIKTGLSACDMGSSYLLPRLMGASKAAEFMLTGRVMHAEEATSCGFAFPCVNDGQVLAEAINIASMINQNSEYGVMMTKSSLRTAAGAASLRIAMEMENRQQVLGSLTGCFEEYISAFSEGRKPAFRDL